VLFRNIFEVGRKLRITEKGFDTRDNIPVIYIENFPSKLKRLGLERWSRRRKLGIDNFIELSTVFE
jgi:hypothetical protein